jgi:hypothetical protein
MKFTRLSCLALSAAVVLATGGCASYRVSSNVDSVPGVATSTAVDIYAADAKLPDRKFKEVGPIEVSVKKLTVFHADPTKEQANLALIERARQIGANAVIGVTYSTGIGFTTWGYIDAKGTGIKFTE